MRQVHKIRHFVFPLVIIEIIISKFELPVVHKEHSLASLALIPALNNNDDDDGDNHNNNNNNHNQTNCSITGQNLKMFHLNHI